MAKFKPGQSGNPGGRPPGSKATTSLIRSEMVSDGDVQKIVAKVVAMAKAGDLSAAGMILDRTIPKLRHRVEDIADEASLAEAIQAARLRAAASSGLRIAVLEDLVASSYRPEDADLQVRTGVTGGLVGGDEQAATKAARNELPTPAARTPEPTHPHPAPAFRMRMDHDDTDAGAYASGDQYNPIGN